MKKQLQQLLLTIGLWLLAYGLQAQEFQWEWAKSGGGGQSASGSTFVESEDDTVRDIVVDADNNYYFLTSLKGGTRTFEGESLTSYGIFDVVDILIVSLDCEGNYRWSHTIGGRLDDQAYKLGLDSTNGLYIGVEVRNLAYIDNVGSEINFPPVHFSEDDVMPLIPYDNVVSPSEAYKMGFLLKLDKDTGELLWRKDLQGMVTSSKRGMIVGRIFIDSNDIVHQIVALQEGVHLDGLVTVAEGELKYFLVKYDTDGNILGIPEELPMTGGFAPGLTIFKYDEQLNRYYLAGASGLSPSKSFGGVPLQESGFYVLAFDADTFEELWRREYYLDWLTDYEEIKEIVIDEDSNIYLAGKYYIYPDDTMLSYFGDYQLPHNVGPYTYGNTPFTMKLNSSGEVQWIRTPDGYTNTTAATGTYYNRCITLNGIEVVVIVNSGAHIWGDFSINRPVSHRADPVILRLNKETGEVI